MGWFRTGLSPFQTPLAMIGAKSGHTVVVLGAADPPLAAQVALVTGLTGRTLVIDPDESARARVEKAAVEAGALVDVEIAPLRSLPLEADSVDVVVLSGDLGARTADERHFVAAETVRVLRPGGRVVAIEVRPRTGLRGAFSRSGPPAVKAEILREVLVATGFRAARVLSQGQSGTYIEAVKPGR
jgi:SAM-dependent methyltransferase